MNILFWNLLLYSLSILPLLKIVLFYRFSGSNFNISHFKSAYKNMPKDLKRIYIWAACVFATRWYLASCAQIHPTHPPKYHHRPPLVMTTTTPSKKGISTAKYSVHHHTTYTITIHNNNDNGRGLGIGQSVGVWSLIKMGKCKCNKRTDIQNVIIYFTKCILSTSLLVICFGWI